MDVVLKNVSVDTLNLLRLSVECSIYNLEKEVTNLEHEYNSISSKYGLCYSHKNMKDKKADLDNLRKLYKQF